MWMDCVKDDMMSCCVCVCVCVMRWCVCVCCVCVCGAVCVVYGQIEEPSKKKTYSADAKSILILILEDKTLYSLLREFVKSMPNAIKVYKCRSNVKDQLYTEKKCIELFFKIL